MPEGYQEQKLHLTTLVKNIRAITVEQCTRHPPPYEVAMRVIDLHLKIFTHLKTYKYASEQSGAPTAYLPLSPSLRKYLSIQGVRLLDFKYLLLRPR